MKTRIIIGLAAIFCAKAFGQGLKISQFPNTAVPGSSDLFVIAVTSTSPGTNKNIRYDQLAFAITNGLTTGLSSSNFAANLASNLVRVAQGDNLVITTNFVDGGVTYTVHGPAFESLTNGVRVALSTNQNWVSGVTGMVNGATAVLGVDIFSITNGLGGGATGFDQFETLTNGVRLALSTNNNWTFGVTGHLSGTTATLGVDALAISNAIVFPTGVAFNTNQFTTNIAGTPVIGALWFNGTTGLFPLTNGPRFGLEWWPSRASLRAGAVGGNLTAFGGSVPASSNYWDSTNIGMASIAFGSNTMASGDLSSVLGGFMNQIPTNSQACVIGGGIFNFFQGRATNCVIAGGTNHNFGVGILNSVVSGGENAVVGAGSRWAFNGGGYQNRIGVSAGFDAQVIAGGYFNRSDSNYVVISGGHNNDSFGEASSIGGGEDNAITGRYGTIAGGKRNRVGFTASVSESGTVGGGASNSVATTGGGYGGVIPGGAQNTVGNMRHGTVSGGLLNTISDFCHYSGIIGGVSNLINNTNAFIIGSWMTNNHSPSIEIGYYNTNKMRVDQQFTRMVNMGTLYMSNTVAWFPTAAQIGVGGYWLGNSNGNLVTLYTLDGSTTVMKILAP